MRHAAPGEQPSAFLGAIAFGQGAEVQGHAFLQLDSEVRHIDVDAAPVNEFSSGRYLGLGRHGRVIAADAPELYEGTDARVEKPGTEARELEPSRCRDGEIPGHGDRPKP